MIEIKRKDGEITSLLAKGKADDIISMLAENMVESSDLMELVEDAYLHAKKIQVNENRKERVFVMIDLNREIITSSVFGTSTIVPVAFAVFASVKDEYFEAIRDGITACTYRRIEKGIEESKINKDE